MTISQNWLVSLGVVCGLLAFGDVATAGHYGAHTYSASRNYSYRKYTYYHLPTRSYHYHMAIYRPHQPQYVYYYNCQTQLYWGRYNLTTGKYALLSNQKKTGDLALLTDEDFLAEGKMPKEEAGADDDLLPPPDAPPVKPAPMPSPAPQPKLLIVTGSISIQPLKGSCHSR